MTTSPKPAQQAGRNSIACTERTSKATMLYLIIVSCMLMTFISCEKKESDNRYSDIIKPQEFPDDLGIEGFNFPEDSTAIYKWLDSRDTVSITRHAWGIWAGLTANSGQVYEGDSLLVFETWLGVKELAKFAKLGNKNGGCTPMKKERTPLSVPKQFIHAQLFANKNAIIDTSFQVYETVSYNPSAACFATEHLIFNQTELDKYKVKDGIGKIPAFPSTAITTKPTYFAGKPNNDGLIRVPVWPGIPNPAKAYKYDVWGTYVYADINNKQPENKKLVPVTTDKPTAQQIKAATCNINDFINYKLDKDAAKYLNLHQDKGSVDFKPGDVVLLVGMHVATREINNWTWQTYFWSYNDNSPFLPSSSFEAGLRPASIKGAASHYAVTTAYAMVWPNQPVNGGTNDGVTPIISFNPYLEAGFGPKVFSVANTMDPAYQYGVQTNCMTCHALATATGNAGYSTDQYISMDNKTLFTNEVQLDFAWSIQGNINKKK